MLSIEKFDICNGLLSFVFRPGRADKKIVSRGGSKSNVNGKMRRCERMEKNISEMTEKKFSA